MAKVLPVARARISIGSATAAYTQVALAADTYTLIGGVRSIPTFGDSYQVINVEEVGDGRTRKGKGTANAGTSEIVCSRRYDDEGQIALHDAAASLDPFNIKIELPVGNGQFSTHYLSALVMSKSKGNGGPNDTQTVTFQLEVDEDPIDVDPA